MGWSNKDIYDNSADFGLEIFGQFEFYDGYDWDYFVVFKETATGRLGWARDAGCSCNSPFEYANDPEETITWATSTEIANELTKQINEGWKPDRDNLHMNATGLIAKLVG